MYRRCCDDVACYCFFFSSRRRHTRLVSDWSSDVCSSDLVEREWSVEGVVRAVLPEIHVLVLTHGEIGRATCRERVKISVDAGSLKKKTKSRNMQDSRKGTKN